MNKQVIRCIQIASVAIFSVRFAIGYGVDPFLYSFLFLTAASLNAVALVIGD